MIVRKRDENVIRRYGCAIIWVAIAALLRAMVGRYIGYESPYLLFVPAILLTAWQGGLGPSLVACAASLFVGDVFFVAPSGHWSTFNLHAYIAAAIFVFLAVTMAAVVSGIRASAQALQNEIAERTQAEQQLREREERLRLIFENARGVAIISMDLEGDIDDWNRGAESMFQLKKDEAVGQSIGIIFEESDRLNHLPEHELAIARRDGCASDERWLSGKGGVRRFVNGVTCAKYGNHGELVGYLKIARDFTDRWQVEEALRRSEERFRRVFESAAVGIVQVDRQGRFVNVNPKFCEITGYTAAELQGRRFIEITHPDDVAVDHDAFLDLLSGKIKNYQHEKRYIRKTGSFVWVRITVSFLRDAHGNANLSVTLVEDITERKGSQDALRQSEERLRLATEAARIGLWHWEVEADRLEFSRILCEQLGLPFEVEKNYRLFLSCVHPDDRLRLHRLTQNCIKRRSPYEIEYRVVWPDKSVHWIWGKGHPIFGPTIPMKFVGVTMEVTARKEVESALQQQAELLDLAQVMVLDLEHRIVFWNKGAETLYGFRKADVIGKVAHEVLQTRFPAAQTIIDVRSKLLCDGSWQGELAQRRADGRPIVVASHWVLHRDKEGTPLAILEANNDITEIKQTQDELAKSRQALEQANNAIALHAEQLEQRVTERTAALTQSLTDMETFLYSIAHDLRAPLRAMIGFSQALVTDYGGKLDETGSDYCNRISSSSERMDQLISDLLAYGRLSHTEVQTTQVDLVQEIDRVLKHATHTIEKSHASVDVAKPLPRVFADVPLLDKVLENLIINAVKFVPPDRQPRIRIYAEPQDHTIRLWIEDNGIGIAREHQGNIFGPFQRLHTTDEYPGTGIGLAIVRKGVERMGGHVGVESEPGKGSRFWIDLPA